MDWVQALLTGVAVLFIGWAAKRVSSFVPSRWSRRQEAKKERERSRTRQDAQARRELLHQQVSASAQVADIDLAWSLDPEWRGPGVCVIHLSGKRSYYIDASERGFGEYEAAMAAGSVPHLSTFPKRAPKTVSHWTEDELRSWLAEYAVE